MRQKITSLQYLSGTLFWNYQSEEIIQRFKKMKEGKKERRSRRKVGGRERKKHTQKHPVSTEGK